MLKEYTYKYTIAKTGRSSNLKTEVKKWLQTNIDKIITPKL